MPRTKCWERGGLLERELIKEEGLNGGFVQPNWTEMSEAWGCRK